MSVTPLQQKILDVLPPEGLTADQLNATLGLAQFNLPGKAAPSALQIRKAAESLHRKMLATISGRRIYNLRRR